MYSKRYEAPVHQFNAIAFAKTRTRKQFRARFYSPVRDCLKERYSLVREDVLDITTHKVLKSLWFNRKRVTCKYTGFYIHGVIKEHVKKLLKEHMRMLDSLPKDSPKIPHIINEIKLIWGKKTL